MKKITITQFNQGISFVRNNPHLLYTIFLIIIIPAAFIFNGQNFLNSSLTVQERLEKDKIGILQDVFAGFSIPHMNDPGFLQNRIEELALLNPAIETFQIYVKNVNGYQVIASSDIDEVGVIESDIYVLDMFKTAQEDVSHISSYMYNDIRYWAAVRELRDPTRGVDGILFTAVSMEAIDTLVSKKINVSYFFLFIIIILIVILLIRTTKIVDYTTLYRKLKEVDVMKDTFVSIAAHELRTPLTIIRGYTEMLVDSELSKENRKLTEKIEQSTEQLNSLITDILDVARIQQGKLSLKIEDVDIESSLSEIVDALQVVAQEKDLVLKWDHTQIPLVRADKERLKQVLMNIIGNAVKYTKKGHVEIKTHTDERNNTVVMRVSDTGVGISADEQKELFHRFYRVRTKETESIRGTGLGLWISKNILTQMKGSISVESIEGKGADFIITLPMVVKNR